jgi:hypothetical protein
VKCHLPTCREEVRPDQQRVCVNGRQDYHWHCFFLQISRLVSRGEAKLRSLTDQVTDLSGDRSQTEQGA